MKIMQLKIDKNFKNLISPLSKEEYEQLKNNIIQEGCRDALICWNGTIVDGHNRYEICREHNIEFRVEEKSFSNKGQVLDWIINNQLGRRNINDSQKAYLRGLQYEREKAKETNAAGVNQYTKEDGVENPHHPKTAERLAEQHKIHEWTIREDAKYAKAIDSIGKNVGTEIKQKILNRELVVPKKDVVKIGKLNARQQKEVFKNPSKPVIPIEVKSSKKPATNTDSQSPKSSTNIDNRRVCTDCGLKKPESDFSSYSGSRCRQCHNSMKNAKQKGWGNELIDIAPGETERILADMTSKKPSDEGSDKNINSYIVTGFEMVVDSFCKEINHYAYMQEEFRKLKPEEKQKMESAVNEAEKWIIKIKMLLEDRSDEK